MKAALLQVIATSSREGSGRDERDPVRVVQEYYATDGTLLAAVDPLPHLACTQTLDEVRRKNGELLEDNLRRRKNGEAAAATAHHREEILERYRDFHRALRALVAGRRPTIAKVRKLLTDKVIL